MNSVFLLAIITFVQGTYKLDHYPVQTDSWIEKVEYNAKKPGEVFVTFKKNTFTRYPSCKWTYLNTDSKSFGDITYHSREKIQLNFFETINKKKTPTNISFILSCKK